MCIVGIVPNSTMLVVLEHMHSKMSINTEHEFSMRIIISCQLFESTFSEYSLLSMTDCVQDRDDRYFQTCDLITVIDNSLVTTVIEIAKQTVINNVVLSKLLHTQIYFILF